MIKVTIGSNINRSTVIIDENTTLRQAFEDAGIDYTLGMASLDGSTLGPGDLNKTFADFGVTEKCYLLTVVKADNAATIKIAGSACIVESAHKLEDIRLLEKFRPNALALFEGENGKKEMTFRVGAAKTGNGSINSVGATFGSQPTGAGKAAITMIIPEGVTDPKKWAADTIGVSIIKLNAVESQFEAALAEVKTEQEAVNNAITVM